MEIKKVIFLDNEPYTQRRKTIFHIQDFFDMGYNVETWDLFQMLYAKIDAQILLTEKHVSIKNIKELDTHIQMQDVSKTMFVLSIGNGWGNIDIYRLIEKYKLFYIHIEVISNFVISHEKKYYKIWQYYGHIIQSLKTRLRIRKARKFYRKFQYRPSFELTPILRSRWAKKNIPFNHPDYDDYFFNKELTERCIDGKYIVFLDFYFPYHPDIKVYSKISLDNAAQRYHEQIKAFFTYLEQKYEMPVIIAAHPKSNYDNDTFGKRKIVYGKTCSLVKHACYVFSHGSNSISYAIMGKKPIALVTTSDINRVYTYKRVLERQSELFKVPVVNISKQELSDFVFYNIQDDVYKTYVNKYLTTEHTCNKSNKESLLEFMNMISKCDNN